MILSIMAFVIPNFFPFLIALLLILLFIYIVVSLYLPFIVPEFLTSLYDTLNFNQQLVVSVFSVGVVLLVFIWLICWWKDMNWVGLMLSSATSVLIKRPVTFVYIFLFYLGIFITLALFVFQHYAFNMTLLPYGPL